MSQWIRQAREHNKSHKGGRRRTLEHAVHVDNSPQTSLTTSKSSRDTPEHELLLRYRHVYAGKGGWHGYRGASAPKLTPKESNTPSHTHISSTSVLRINGARSPMFSDSVNGTVVFGKYSKEILSKITKTLQLQSSELEDGGDEAGKNGSSANTVGKATALTRPPSTHTLAVDISDHNTHSSVLVITNVPSRESEPKPSTGQEYVNSASEKQPNQDDNCSNSSEDMKKSISVDVHIAKERLHPSSASVLADFSKGDHHKLGSRNHAESTRRNMHVFSRMSVEAQTVVRDLIPEKQDYSNEDEDQTLDLSLLQLPEDTGQGPSSTGPSCHSCQALQEYEDPSPRYISSISASPVQVTRNQDYRTTLNGPQDVNKSRPWTKLPSISTERSISEDSDIPHGKHLIPGIGRFKVIPFQSLHREQTFKITPQGYDSRYTEPIRSLNDNTPEEIKAHARAKCTDWINKYL